MSDFFEYLLRLLRTLFEIRNVIEGKLVLQKTFYFAKELGLDVPFTFRWGKLGPYSYELSNVMSRVSSLGFAPYNGTYEYDERFFRRIDELEIPESIPRFFYNIDDVCEDNDYNIVNFYEVLSSLHFLFRYSDLSTRHDVAHRLNDLKYNRMEMLAPLLIPAWDFLQEHELLRKTSLGVSIEL